MNTFTSKFVFDDVVYESAVFRVKKIVTANSDYELISNNVDANEDQHIEWVVREESTAVVFVWPDMGAYNHRALPMSHFTVDFRYDGTLGEDIYAQAINAIKASTHLQFDE